MMYINYIILRLLLPFLCITVYKADAQGFVSFPAETTISSPGTIVSTDGNEIEVDLTMNGATPTRANQTVCTGYNLAANDLFYIFQFTGHADYSTVHHMGLYACSITPANSACQCPMANRSPLFTWARNTPPVRFTGSGTRRFGVFKVGSGTDRSFMFLETHYHHAFNTPDRTSGIKIRMTRNLNTPRGEYYELAIFSLMGTGTIPANMASYSINTCFSLNTRPSTFKFTPVVLGFQSHTHNLGRLVSTFYKSNFMTEIALGNPMWPNSYTELSSALPPSSRLYNRCIYTSTGVANDTNTNGKFVTPTAWHEMCVQSLILAASSKYDGPWSSTTPAFLTGTCSASDLTTMNSRMPTVFPTINAATNDALNTYATSGIGSGRYSYSSERLKDYNINLTLQTFSGSLG